MNTEPHIQQPTPERRGEAPFECFELPWPASWTLWIVCVISVVVGFAIGWVLA